MILDFLSLGPISEDLKNELMGHTKNKIAPNNTQYHTIYTIAQNMHISKYKIDTIAHNTHNSMKPNTKYTH